MYAFWIPARSQVGKLRRRIAQITTQKDRIQTSDQSLARAMEAWIGHLPLIPIRRTLARFLRLGILIVILCHLVTRMRRIARVPKVAIVIR